MNTYTQKIAKIPRYSSLAASFDIRLLRLPRRENTLTRLRALEPKTRIGFKLVLRFDPTLLSTLPPAVPWLPTMHNVDAAAYLTPIGDIGYMQKGVEEQKML